MARVPDIEKRQLVGSKGNNAPAAPATANSSEARRFWRCPRVNKASCHHPTALFIIALESMDPPKRRV